MDAFVAEALENDLREEDEFELTPEQWKGVRQAEESASAGRLLSHEEVWNPIREARERHMDPTA